MLVEVHPPYRRHLVFIRLHLLVVLFTLSFCFFNTKIERELLYTVDCGSDGFNFAYNLAFLSFFVWSSGIGVIHFRRQSARAGEFLLKARLWFIYFTCGLVVIYCGFKFGALTIPRFSPDYFPGTFFFVTVKLITIVVGILAGLILSFPKRLERLILFFYDFLIIRSLHRDLYALLSILEDLLFVLRPNQLSQKSNYISALGEKLGLESEEIRLIKEASILSDIKQGRLNQEPQETLSAVRRELIDNSLAGPTIGRPDTLKQLYFFHQAIRCLFLFVFIVAFVFATLNCFAVPEELLELWQAHERWESAFENASLKEAEKIWSHEDDVIGIDSLGLKSIGWKQVRRQLVLGFVILGRSNLVTLDVVVSMAGDIGCVTGKYIIEGAFLNKTFKATELYRREYGQWRLYYDDGLGNKPPLFPDDEETVKRLVAQAKWAYLAFDLPNLEELFAPSHRYLDYTGRSFCGREASITALREEQNSISLLQFDDVIIFLWQEEENLTAEATFQLRYNAEGETKNAYGSFLLKKQDSWKLVLTNLFGHTEKENLPWDVNCDGIVDISDLVLVGQHFGEYHPSEGCADVNGDGVVDISDLVVIGRHFGEKY